MRDSGKHHLRTAVRERSRPVRTDRLVPHGGSGTILVRLRSSGGGSDDVPARGQTTSSGETTSSGVLWLGLVRYCSLISLCDVTMFRD